MATWQRTLMPLVAMSRLRAARALTVVLCLCKLVRAALVLVETRILALKVSVFRPARVQARQVATLCWRVALRVLRRAAQFRCRVAQARRLLVAMLPLPQQMLLALVLVAVLA